MPAPLLLIPTGIGIGLSKRAENKRQQAAANEYSKKYKFIIKVQNGYDKEKND